MNAIINAARSASDSGSPTSAQSRQGNLANTITTVDLDQVVTIMEHAEVLVGDGDGDFWVYLVKQPDGRRQVLIQGASGRNVLIG